MRTLALLPLLAACGAEAPTEDAATPATMAVAQAAVPGTYGMNLSATGAALPGNTITFTATGAAPGERVYFALGFSEQIGALCPPVLGGGCIDIRSPQLLRTVNADPSGTATITTTVPGTVAPGGTAYFQALSATATSNTVLRFNPEDTGAITNNYEIFGQVSPSLGGSRGYIGPRLIGSATGHDRCAAGYAIPDDPATSTTPCPDCEFAFGTDVPIVGGEFADFGSACVDLFGADLAAGYTFPYGLALGFDDDYGTVDLGYNFPGYPTEWAYLAYPVSFDAAGRFSSVLSSYAYGTY